MRQFPLILDHRVSFGEQDFLVSSGNEPAFKAVRQWPKSLGQAFALFGPAASGKTHLAEIWRSMTKAVRFDPTILTVDDPPHLVTAPALLADPLAFPLAENALLHLLNAVREQGCGLLLVAREAPVRWPVRLPDLRSRLAALPAIGLTAPDDALLAAVIVKLFADRQVRISPDVPEYLLRRIDRSFSAVSATVARLDQAALAQSRPITLALAREVLSGSAAPLVSDDARPA